MPQASRGGSITLPSPFQESEQLVVCGNFRGYQYCSLLAWEEMVYQNL